MLLPESGYAAIVAEAAQAFLALPVRNVDLIRHAYDCLRIKGGAALAVR